MKQTLRQQFFYFALRLHKINAKKIDKIKDAELFCTETLEVLKIYVAIILFNSHFKSIVYAQRNF